MQSQLQQLTDKQRKQDTRDKIQLGGLVVKAGLREEHKAVILGMLLEAAEKMQKDKADYWYNHFKEMGQNAFDKDG